MLPLNGLFFYSVSSLKSNVQLNSMLSESMILNSQSILLFFYFIRTFPYLLLFIWLFLQFSLFYFSFFFLMCPSFHLTINQCSRFFALNQQRSFIHFQYSHYWYLFFLGRTSLFRFGCMRACWNLFRSTTRENSTHKKKKWKENGTNIKCEYIYCMDEQKKTIILWVQKDYNCIVFRSNIKQLNKLQMKCSKRQQQPNVSYVDDVVFMDDDFVFVCYGFGTYISVTNQKGNGIEKCENCLPNRKRSYEKKKKNKENGIQSKWI